MTSFKFFRHKDGLSAFAAISLEIVESSSESVMWAEKAFPLESIYGDAVRLGVKDALDWHVASGGRPASFVVSDFTELIVDTKPDAARCAATAAAWIALGHKETELIFEKNGEWRVNLPGRS